MITEQEVKNAIVTILEDRVHYATSLNYAVNYCKASAFLTGHELGVQCLYILNNLSSWRHPQAKEVRRVLKQYAKEN